MPSDIDTRRVAEKAHIIDIATAKTLPAYYYTDPAVWVIEKRHLFYCTWQYACHISDLAAPGDFTTMSIFDQDIMLIHGHDGVIRAFYNVCVHRGHQLVEGTGRIGRLVCPYHAWTYQLDGQLIGVRRGKATTQITKSEICLTQVRVDRLLDFIFVNLDVDAEPLSSYAAGLADQISAAVPGLSDFEPQGNWRVFDDPFACNWKALVDNYLECYHCETAHPTFCDMFNACDVTHTFADHHMRQHMPSAHKSETAAYRIDLENHLLDGNFWFLFPNTLFVQVPGAPSINISRIIATSPETCVRDADFFVIPDADPDHLAERNRFASEKVGAEDRALVEGVQKGMRQHGFNQGLYVIDPNEENFTEEGVRFFHTRYANMLEDILAKKTR